MLTRLFKGLACGVHHAVSGIACGHELLELFIRLGINLGILHHLFDLIIRETAGGSDANRLLFASGFVFRGHVQNAVGIQVKCHLNLRHTARRGRNVSEVKAAQRLILCRLLALTLHHMDSHRGLVVLSC